MHTVCPILMQVTPGAVGQKSVKQVKADTFLLCHCTVVLVSQYEMEHDKMLRSCLCNFVILIDVCLYRFLHRG